MIPEKHEKVSCETNENVEKIRTFHIQDKILKRRDQCRRIVQDQLFELFFMLNSGDMVDYKVCKKNFNDFDRMARFFKKKQLFTHKPIILPPTESQGNLTILKEDFKLNGSSSEPKIDFVAPKMVELSDSLLKHNKKWTYIGEKPYREVMLKDMKSVATNFKRQYHRKVRAAKFYASEANKVRMVKVYKPLTEFTRDTRKAVNHCKYLAFMINKFWHEAIFIHQIRFHRSQLIELINLYKYSFDDIHQPISLMGMKNLAFLGASGCHLSSMKYKTQFIETSEAHDHITEKLTESRKRKMSPDTLHPIELFPGLPSEAAQYLAYGRDLASKLFPRNILVPNGHLFPLTLLKRTLWPYQMVGVEWLVNLFDSDVNGILIQGTELGDTVQIIAYLVSLAEHKHVWGPHLIVVPKVDMLRWYNDFQEWCPGLKVHLYYKPEVSLNRCTTDDSSGFHQVVITSYEFMGCRSQHLTNQKWCCLILGTGIIPDPRLNQILTKVVSERRVLITDSRPELMVSQFDLKDLLNFLLPHNLQSYDISGLKSSNVEMDKISSNKYIELLEPFILYRNLDDIKDQIPRMEEIFVECPMKLQQVNLYHNYLSETYMSLFGSKGPTNLQFINILIDLCCHPELCTPHLPKTPYVSPPLIQHVPLSLTFETFDFFKPLLFLPSEFDPAASALTSAKIFGGSDQLSFGLKVKDCLGKNTRYENTSTPQVVKNPNYCSCTYLCRCSLSIKNTLSGKILLNTPQMKQYYKTRLEYNVIRTLENSPPPLYGERTRNFFKLDDDWSWMRGFDMYNKLLDLVDYDYFRKFRCVLPSKTQTWPFVLHPSRLGLYLRTNCPIISPDWGHIFDKSGKLQRLDQLLAHITTKRSKIVIISQSLEILDMLEKYMCYRNLRYVRVDHTSAFEDHIILGDMFDKNISVNFLITTTITDAFDLNLSKADRFVLFDVEWRPNLRARLENYLKHACHNRKIYVYKLFAVGTIEEFLKETDLFGLINDKNLDAAKSAVEKITDLTLKKLLLAITEQKDLNFNQSDVFDSISRKAGRGKISDISQSILANCDLVSPIELFAMRQINMADLMVLRKKMTDHENIPLDSKDRQIVEELQDLHLHSLPSDKIKKFDGFHAKELTKKVYHLRIHEQQEISDSKFNKIDNCSEKKPYLTLSSCSPSPINYSVFNSAEKLIFDPTAEKLETFASENVDTFDRHSSSGSQSDDSGNESNKSASDVGIPRLSTTYTYAKKVEWFRKHVSKEKNKLKYKTKEAPGPNPALPTLSGPNPSRVVDIIRDNKCNDSVKNADTKPPPPKERPPVPPKITMNSQPTITLKPVAIITAPSRASHSQPSLNVRARSMTPRNTARMATPRHGNEPIRTDGRITFKEIPQSQYVRIAGASRASNTSANQGQMINAPMNLGTPSNIRPSVANFNPNIPGIRQFVTVRNQTIPVGPGQQLTRISNTHTPRPPMTINNNGSVQSGMILNPISAKTNASQFRQQTRSMSIPPAPVIAFSQSQPTRQSNTSRMIHNIRLSSKMVQNSNVFRASISSPQEFSELNRGMGQPQRPRPEMPRTSIIANNQSNILMVSPTHSANLPFELVQRPMRLFNSNNQARSAQNVQVIPPVTTRPSSNTPKNSPA